MSERLLLCSSHGLHAGNVLLKRSIDDDGCAGAARTPSRSRTRDRVRETRTGVYLLVVLTAGAYLPSPLYPVYQGAFGFSDLTMTLVYAMFALVSGPALLLFGPASDALGLRAVLRTSVVVAAVASLCFVIANGPVLLLIGRAAQGLALGAATGAATALITRCAPADKRARASVLASMAFVGGTAVGPVAAGVLAQYGPAAHMLPYLVHLLVLALGWHRLSDLPAARPRSTLWRPTRPGIPAGMRRVFATSAATGFLAWTAAGLFLSIIPAILGRAAQTSNLAITGGVVSAVLVCSLLCQPLVVGCGPRRAQLAGLGALLVSLVALALTGGGSVPVTLIAAVTAGIGHGLAYGGATATVDAALPDSRRGSITSALYLAFYLGAGVPAVAIGLLSLWQPLTTATSWLSAVAAALVPVIGVALMLTNHSSRPPRAKDADAPGHQHDRQRSRSRRLRAHARTSERRRPTTSPSPKGPNPSRHVRRGARRTGRV